MTIPKSLNGRGFWGSFTAMSLTARSVITVGNELPNPASSMIAKKEGLLREGACRRKRANEGGCL